MSKQDLCVHMEDGILNIRVGAIIMKGNKFLMVGNDRFDHLVLCQYLVQIKMGDFSC